jgi:hypothetical protein
MISTTIILIIMRGPGSQSARPAAALMNRGPLEGKRKSKHLWCFERSYATRQGATSMTNETAKLRRLTIDITEHQYQMLRKHLEHGMQKKIFSIIIDDVILMFEVFGGYFVTAMLEKQITYKKMMENYFAAPRHTNSATTGYEL